MRKAKKATIVIVTMLLMLLASCKFAPTVASGKYYLDGDENNPYIEIISDNTMRFVNFDVGSLTDYLVREGTGLEGKEAEEYMTRHNLPNAFAEEIAFELFENSIYVKALSEEAAGSPVVNYRMVYENETTLVFMEHTYIRFP